MGKLGTVLLVVLLLGWLFAPTQTGDMIEALFTALGNRIEQSTTPAPAR